MTQSPADKLRTGFAPRGIPAQAAGRWKPAPIPRQDEISPGVPAATVPRDAADTTPRSARFPPAQGVLWQSSPPRWFCRFPRHRRSAGGRGQASTRAAAAQVDTGAASPRCWQTSGTARRLSETQAAPHPAANARNARPPPASGLAVGIAPVRQPLIAAECR
ncbi:hypothetical protein U14_03338 [Candidatus Moduliflexus flocculans]|uniref:Uncharacterized protein n=1 Tax=Candidatus Moduliflexus flocculans TaxID=1499966 RepID=A0A081BNX4_9BACT|nr:hypothetical protein U14_03338 [Candidatus Moduliflexus flocculans]